MLTRQKALVFILAVCIIGAVLPNISANAFAIEETDSFSEAFSNKDAAPEGRHFDILDLFITQASIKQSVLSQYVIRTSSLKAFSAYFPLIVPIRGSPHT